MYFFSIPTSHDRPLPPYKKPYGSTLTPWDSKMEAIGAKSPPYHSPWVISNTLMTTKLTPWEDRNEAAETHSCVDHEKVSTPRKTPTLPSSCIANGGTKEFLAACSVGVGSSDQSTGGNVSQPAPP